MHPFSNARETDLARQAVNNLHLVYRVKERHSRLPVTEQHHVDGYTINSGSGALTIEPEGMRRCCCGLLTHGLVPLEVLDDCW